MLQIENTVLSFDILEKKFKCNVSKCKGACCVLGDSGAPLNDDEAVQLEKILPEIKPYMRKEGIAAIKKQGCYTIDKDGDKVTALIDNKECAFVVFENGIAKCAIEKTFFVGKINFRKPISCHLYPIRTTKYATFNALNYHKWDICSDAVKCGEKENIPMYVFLKEPLTCAYGEKWYEQLEIAASELKKIKK